MSGSRQHKIRNFCIIAHIDHGKSTLADRLLEITGVLTQREMDQQVLDTMELEKERGITIKAQAVRLTYKDKMGDEYILNLIDTPGHVDFSYEVSRSLAACEGAILVVDASQGIEAQTLANVYLALDHDLEIIPVINKIDLPSAQPEHVKKEIEDIIGLDASDAPLVSAKNGIGIEEVLERVVQLIPPPEGDEDAPLRALAFDSVYDNYRGVIAYIRVMEGRVKPGDRIKMMATGKEFDVTEVGFFKPTMTAVDELKAGDVGYLAASIKNVRDTHVGDTITHAKRPAAEPLPGYKKVNPMVFSGIYPADGAHYGDLRDALERLQLNDAALMFEAETSVALGFGFRCGFLGLLHMEIIQERLEREYDLDLVTTAPSVIYRVVKTNGEMVEISNPTNLPPAVEIEFMEEPVVKAQIMAPTEFVGPIMELCQERRGDYKHMEYIEDTRVMLTYELPLNEIMIQSDLSKASRKCGKLFYCYILSKF
jgi:GTP-binding protein LepA